jgi:hypothetical protein
MHISHFTYVLFEVTSPFGRKPAAATRATHAR